MPDPLYVIGHRNPDTDSVVAAAAYAELLRRQDEPFAVVAARAGPMRPETEHLLKRFGVEPPELVEDLRLRVGDVMTTPARTVREGDSLYEVGRRQLEMGMRPLPVVDGRGQLCGIAEAQDFAKVFFQGLDPAVADRVPVDVDNLVQALDARVLVRAAERTRRLTVMVAAWSLETIRRRVERDTVLLVGDRFDVQRAAIEMGIGMLVVTGGADVPADVLRLAEERRVTLLAVEHHTAATLRLIHMSIPVSVIMRRDPPRAEADDLVDDVRDLLGAERALSVVDESQRVVGVLTRTDVLRARRRRVVLVDHNERAQAVNGIEQADIVGVVDHHRVADLVTTQPPVMRLEPLGACSTLIAKLYREAGVDIAPPYAGIMLGAILTDTLLFQSPTTTPEDRATAERLAAIADVGADELGAELIAIQSDVSDRSADQLVRGDFKSFVIDDVRFGVGVIETGDAGRVLARRAELLRAMRQVRRDGYATVLLVVTDMVHRRTTILVEGNAKAVARTFEADLRDGAAIDLPGVYSRKKQVVPLLGRIKELLP
ncbi:MAG TPA: putative manganese-dependent inorganic diphosphatase [Chloroflexota bacterium]|nr:putative manganese-dependent inorganic diphosphatase [Chloroflexota bacterium]